jgi:hypothetical protein
MTLVLHGGHGKTLFLTRDSIRIVREHLDERHDIAILIRHIAAVAVKKPGAFDGFIHFSIAGGRTHDSGHGLTGGSFDAARDEHAVTFSSMDDYDVALKVKLHVETWSPALHAPSASPADEVRELKSLLDKGR